MIWRGCSPPWPGRLNWESWPERRQCGLPSAGPPLRPASRPLPGGQYGTGGPGGPGGQLVPEPGWPRYWSWQRPGWAASLRPTWTCCPARFSTLWPRRLRTALISAGPSPWGRGSECRAPPRPPPGRPPDRTVRRPPTRPPARPPTRRNTRPPTGGPPRGRPVSPSNRSAAPVWGTGRVRSSRNSARALPARRPCPPRTRIFPSRPWPGSAAMHQGGGRKKSALTAAARAVSLSYDYR
jgi:hypothetical protein